MLDVMKIAALKDEIATSQRQLVALYIEGIEALGQTYTQEAQDDWETVLLSTRTAEPYLEGISLRLDALESFANYAIAVANGEFDEDEI